MVQQRGGPVRGPEAVPAGTFSGWIPRRVRREGRGGPARLRPLAEESAVHMLCSCASAELGSVALVSRLVCVRQDVSDALVFSQLKSCPPAFGSFEMMG